MHKSRLKTLWRSAAPKINATNTTGSSVARGLLRISHSAHDGGKENNSAGGVHASTCIALEALWHTGDRGKIPVYRNSMTSVNP